METITITMHPESPAQMEAVKAFFKALKIKHTINKEDSKMSEAEYFDMLNSRISNSKKNKPTLISPEYQNEILFGK
jgi:hypothetical protein